MLCVRLTFLEADLALPRLCCGEELLVFLGLQLCNQRHRGQITVRDVILTVTTVLLHETAGKGLIRFFLTLTLALALALTLTVWLCLITGLCRVCSRCLVTGIVFILE